MAAPLSIQIVFRTPVGGLFRHVRDLARGLHEEGQRVGVICDSLTGGPNASDLLGSIEKYCELGVVRIPVSRLPGLGDVSAVRRVAKLAAGNRPDIIHGHGAKGGLYARLAGRLLGVPSLYVPHGGSLHFEWSKPAGAVFLATEKLLRPLGSGLHFVCDFERDEFAAKVGVGRTPFRVVHNGLWPEEFKAVTPAPDATDVVYVGELRYLKGVDVLLRALAIAAEQRPLSATIVGDGEDRAAFEELARELKLGNVRFTGILPARQGFALGRIFVMPSRAESFPYVILEAAAAQLPIVASKVGGVPEILPEDSLVPPDDPAALAQALLDRVAHPRGASLTPGMQKHLDSRRMTRDILAFYHELSH